MKILSIETSCDETAASILDIKGSATSPSITVLGNALFSQIDIHKEYGGVYPALAKREHVKNLPLLLHKAMTEAGFLVSAKKVQISLEKKAQLESTLLRETSSAEALYELFSMIKKPKLDVIAVTTGPGLEPALWVGINIAKALGELWNIPVIPVNHMEGHFFSVLHKTQNLDTKITLTFPALALLISGGHTELVYSKFPLHYIILGQTRDDAVGEAYDKVARMLGLPYPGGPQISALAETSRKKTQSRSLAPWSFPRPMLHSKDLDFSFSGLKTSVLYAIKDKNLSQVDREEIAREFEEAVTEVLIQKTRKALKQSRVKTLIIAGGVAANNYIKQEFIKLLTEFPKVKLLIPENKLTGDNSIMIGIAAFQYIKNSKQILKQKAVITADGNLRFNTN